MDYHDHVASIFSDMIQSEQCNNVNRCQVSKSRTNKSYPCQLLIVFLVSITIVIYHKLQFSLSQNTQCVVPACKMYLSEDCIWFNIFSFISKSQLLQNFECIFHEMTKRVSLKLQNLQGIFVCVFVSTFMM